MPDFIYSKNPLYVFFFSYVGIHKNIPCIYSVDDTTWIRLTMSNKDSLDGVRFRTEYLGVLKRSQTDRFCRYDVIHDLLIIYVDIKRNIDMYWEISF